MLKQATNILPVRALLPAVWLVWVASSAAHTLPISFLTLVPDENYLHLELELNPFELTFFSELEEHRAGRLDPRELDGDKIARRILDAVKVRVEGRLITADVAGLTQSFENHHLTVRAHYAADARQATVSVESKLVGITSGAHLTQVTFGDGDHTQAARLDGQSDEARFEPAASPATALHTESDPPIPGGSVGQHELTVVLLLCIVSALLLARGSLARLLSNLHEALHRILPHPQGRRRGSAATGRTRRIGRVAADPIPSPCGEGQDAGGTRARAVMRGYTIMQSTALSPEPDTGIQSQQTQ